MVKFLVLALFYGDHPELAQRCGQTLRALRNTGQVDLAVGLNEVSPRSRAVLDELLPDVETESADPQIYKCPMMRRLLAGYRGDATHLMWFDDDSCLQPGVQAAPWLRAVTARAEHAPALGALYTQHLTPAQRDWVRQQPWFTGREVPETILFPTGGWTVVPLDLIRRFDWPGEALGHNGSDLVLGALLHQQGLEPQAFRMGLAINADAQLRESEAPRRGYVETPDQHTWGTWRPEP
ncbi:hypothetical protein FN976_12770 [Caenimonas sedimenti]|uniref:Glycosyltransferase family 2 protein n=1 Tax=Caenimonas sedimenti TaxID=2596921 RepID=A0A562ZRA4_9BURK|nr:hypothetical protein [Caenimonas sedimenti]TWO70835.1 hypothetical protein FN976_12770 [Caenimonas sedimenti]